MTQKEDSEQMKKAKLGVAGKITSKAFLGTVGGYMVGRFAKQITD